MKRTGRTLTAGFLLLAGTGFLLLPGAGIAHAQPGATPVTCTRIAAATKSWLATLTANHAKFATDHTAYMKAVDNYGGELTTIASTGSPALQSAVKTYVTDDEAETASGDLNTSRLSAEFDRVSVLACTPSGAPRTGGGSAAAFQHPVLFGTGGAAALAGLVVVGLTLRNRSRTSADHG